MIFYSSLLIFLILNSSYTFARLTPLSDVYVVSINNNWINTRRYVDAEFVPGEEVQVAWTWNTFNPSHALRVYFVYKHGIGQQEVPVGADEDDNHIPVYQLRRIDNEKDGQFNFVIPTDWPSGVYYPKFSEYERTERGTRRVAVSHFRKVAFVINNKLIKNRGNRLQMNINKRVEVFDDAWHEFWMESGRYLKDGVKFGYGLVKDTGHVLAKITGVRYILRKLDGRPRELDDAIYHRDRKRFTPRHSHRENADD